MGGGSWTDESYKAREEDRRSRGETAFHFSERTTRTRPRSEWFAHADLDPKKVCGPTSPLAGKNFREARDHEEHPDAVGVATIFDHTGSMGDVPKVLQVKLPQLMGTILRHSYLDHPQVLFGAVGDAHSDRAPLQVGQFESDVRMDDDLNKLLLEGNGGAFGEESYELALYFFARHSALDCYEKRGEKGYLFLIGDEEPYPMVSARQVQDIIGDELGQDVPIEQIVAEVQEMYHVYFIIPQGAHGTNHKPTTSTWVRLLGQENVIRLDDPKAVCETIALAIGLREGKIDLETGLLHLEEGGSDGRTRLSVSTALATVAEGVSKGVARAESSGVLPEVAAEGGVARI